MSFRNLEWLFPVVLTLHNAEEAVWLPGWAKRVGRWHLGYMSTTGPGKISPGAFRFLVAAITVLAFAVTWLSVQSGKQTVWTYLAFGYMVTVLANVLIPHVAASVALRSYVPGVVTAVVLNLPVLSLLVALALRQGYVSGWKAVAYSAGVAGFLLLCIAALYKFGRASDS